MHVPVVTAHVGTVPAEADSPTRKLIYQAVDAIGAMADRAGVRFGIETGQEEPAVLADLLAQFNNAALGINYDPANLLMNGFDPIAGVGTLAGHIVYVHAKDAVGGLPSKGRQGREVELGQGDVDYPAFLAALDSAGYHGWHTVEHKRSVNPVAELAAACEYLKGLVT